MERTRRFIFNCGELVKIAVYIYMHKVVVTLVVLKIFYFHPYLGKIPILTNIFQRG